jgi:hypothetical protein
MSYLVDVAVYKKRMPIEWIELHTFSYQKQQRALPLHHDSYNRVVVCLS